MHFSHTYRWRTIWTRGWRFMFVAFTKKPSKDHRPNIILKKMAMMGFGPGYSARSSGSMPQLRHPRENFWTHIAHVSLSNSLWTTLKLSNLWRSCVKNTAVLTIWSRNPSPIPAPTPTTASWFCFVTKNEKVIECVFTNYKVYYWNDWKAKYGTHESHLEKGLWVSVA